MIAKKPLKPKDLIVKWTEFVAEFQDLSNLDIAGRDFHFAKYFLLDIIVPLALLAIIAAFVVLKLLRCILRKVSLALRVKEKKL